MKKCSLCKELKHLNDYHKHDKNKDGLRSVCKECRKPKSRAYYLKNRKKIIKRVNEYSNTEKAKKARSRRQKVAYKKDKSKIAARNKLNDAVRRGKIKKQPCKVCGEIKNLEAHHIDYDKPLLVEWYCSYHHRKIEGRLINKLI